MRFKVSTAPHIRTSDTTGRIMRDVCIALLPALIAGIYFFGYRSLLITFICVLSCVVFEAGFAYLAKRKIRINDFSAVVTGMLIALSLPVTASWWMCVVGSGVAILLAKQLFGGIGDNFLNPALTARAVLLASWPVRMSSAAYVTPNYLGSVDSVSSATPLSAIENTGVWDLFIGNIPGSIGEVCKAAILIGFAYLLIRRVISWQVPVILSLTTALLVWAFEGGDYMTPVNALFTGGLLFSAVFMATDYTTTPMTAVGQIIFAIGAGVLIAVIRCFGGYPEGVTYAILFMNIATPLLDKYIKPKVYGEVGKNAQHS